MKKTPYQQGWDAWLNFKKTSETPPLYLGLYLAPDWPPNSGWTERDEWEKGWEESKKKN